MREVVVVGEGCERWRSKLAPCDFDLRTHAGRSHTLRQKAIQQAVISLPRCTEHGARKNPLFFLSLSGSARLGSRNPRNPCNLFPLAPCIRSTRTSSNRDVVNLPPTEPASEENSLGFPPLSIGRTGQQRREAAKPQKARCASKWMALACLRLLLSQSKL